MGQYFDNQELPSKFNEIETSLLGVHLKLLSDNGVFSKKNIDYGTRVLLESIPLLDIKEKVLDMGCGYGPIGLSIAKKLDIEVDMVDVNRRALHLVEMNAKRNKIHSVNVIESHCYQNIDPNIKYKTIITNPPIRAGKKVVYEICLGARFHLENDGYLFIVVRKEQGAKSMKRDLEEYYDVEVLNKDRGYFVYKCSIKESIS